MIQKAEGNGQLKIKVALKNAGKGMELLGFASAALPRFEPDHSVPASHRRFTLPCHAAPLSLCSTANYPQRYLCGCWLFTQDNGQFARGILLQRLELLRIQPPCPVLPGLAEMLFQQQLFQLPPQLTSRYVARVGNLTHNENKALLQIY